VARPCDPAAALGLDLDAAKLNVVVRVLLLLQVWAELTYVWQAWLHAFTLLFLWLSCCGIGHSRNCSIIVPSETNTAQS